MFFPFNQSMVSMLPKNRVTLFLSGSQTCYKMEDIHLKLLILFILTAALIRNMSPIVLSYFQGSADYGSEPRLDGINISIGRRGESCSSVFRAKGQTCVPSRLSVLNKCEILQKYMRCKSGCFSSLGPDQPAQVVDEAPSNLNPGACLYMQMDEGLTCDGSHQHTRRLCPCA